MEALGWSLHVTGSARHRQAEALLYMPICRRNLKVAFPSGFHGLIAIGKQICRRLPICRRADAVLSHFSELDELARHHRQFCLPIGSRDVASAHRHPSASADCRSCSRPHFPSRAPLLHFLQRAAFLINDPSDRVTAARYVEMERRATSGTAAFQNPSLKQRRVTKGA